MKTEVIIEVTGEIVIAEDYMLDLPIYVKEAPDTQPMPVPTSETHNAMFGFGVESMILILLVAFLLIRN